MISMLVASFLAERLVPAKIAMMRRMPGFTAIAGNAIHAIITALITSPVLLLGVGWQFWTAIPAFAVAHFFVEVLFEVFAWMVGVPTLSQAVERSVENDLPPQIAALEFAIVGPQDAMLREASHVAAVVFVCMAFWIPVAA